jgi:hypothetical protein
MANVIQERGLPFLLASGRFPPQVTNGSRGLALEIDLIKAGFLIT